MSKRIEQRDIKIGVCVGFDCDACGATIETLDDGSGLGREMLTIRVYGGYGEYLDGEVRSELCRNCAKALQDKWPTLFDEERGD